MRHVATAIALLFTGGAASCAHQSQAELVAQERSFCRGLPQNAGSDLDFILANETEDVIPLRAAGRPGAWVQGAALSIPPKSGRTPELLQRLGECRLAQLAAHPAPVDAASPLAVPGVGVRVRSAGDRFAVELRGAYGTGDEILSRANALLARATAVENAPPTSTEPAQQPAATESPTQ